jgi:hypothetical protein
MKSICISVLLTVFLLCIGSLVLGCNVSPEVVYPLKVTITGIPNPPPHEIMSIGIFDDVNNIMPKPGELDLMPQKATAGGVGKVKDGKVTIELMDPVKQVNFTKRGEYYMALMFGDSMENLQGAYIYVNSDDPENSLRKGMQLAATMTDKDQLSSLINGTENPIQTLEDEGAILNYESTIDLSFFETVKPMFDTLFGDEE